MVMFIEPLDDENIETLGDLIEEMEESCASFPIPISKQLQQQVEDDKIKVCFIDVDQRYKIDKNFDEGGEERDIVDKIKNNDFDQLPYENLDIGYEIREFMFNPKTHARITENTDNESKSAD